MIDPSNHPAVHRAIVKDNKDPKHLRRVKVTVQQTTRGEVTDWAWPIISTERPPAIGSGVWVFYLGGDLDYPVWVGEFGSKSQGLFSYGSWHSRTAQTASINTPKAITLEKTDFSSGVTLKSGSKLYVDQTATYNIQISLQVHNVGGGGSGSSFAVWFRKNGTDVPASASQYNVPSNQYAVPSLNIFLPLKAGDYVQVMWAVNNTVIQLAAPASTVGGGPQSPSAIVTVSQVA